MPTNSTHHSPDTGGVIVRQQVSISRWVNEPYPAWDCILTAHDVARLIRRPPWMLSTLAAVRQFPRKQQFRGRKIGWLKADILEWMARTRRCPTNAPSHKAYRAWHRQPDPPNQPALPLKLSSFPALSGQRTVSYATGVSP